jgi:hypothetical protein
MFLIKDRRLGMTQFVFLHDDPKNDGFEGEVEIGVSLKYDWEEIHKWPHGTFRPDPKLGRDPANPKIYQVFKNPDDLAHAGFEFVHVNTPIVAGSWKDYRTQYYPVPAEFAEKMSQEEWFQFLDDADTAAKIRKGQVLPQRPPKGGNPQQFAEWIAKRHMNADKDIQQVWYLTTGSPEYEIRLLEVNEQLGEMSGPLEPLDFGLDVDGTRLKLLVADVTPSQMEEIRVAPEKILPKGWSLADAIIWGRRGLIK